MNIQEIFLSKEQNIASSYSNNLFKREKNRFNNVLMEAIPYVNG